MSSNHCVAVDNSNGSKDNKDFICATILFLRLTKNVIYTVRVDLDFKSY